MSGGLALQTVSGVLIVQVTKIILFFSIVICDIMDWTSSAT